MTIPDKSADLSMEEILASIRQIIADEPAATGPSPGAARTGFAQGVGAPRAAEAVAPRTVEGKPAEKTAPAAERSGISAVERFRNAALRSEAASSPTSEAHPRPSTPDDDLAGLVEPTRDTFGTKPPAPSPSLNRELPEVGRNVLNASAPAATPELSASAPSRSWPFTRRTEKATRRVAPPVGFVKTEPSLAAQVELEPQVNTEPETTEALTNLDTRAEPHWLDQPAPSPAYSVETEAPVASVESLPVEPAALAQVEPEPAFMLEAAVPEPAREPSIEPAPIVDLQAMQVASPTATEAPLPGPGRWPWFQSTRRTEQGPASEPPSGYVPQLPVLAPALAIEQPSPVSVMPDAASKREVPVQVPSVAQLTLSPELGSPAPGVVAVTAQAALAVPAEGSAVAPVVAPSDGPAALNGRTLEETVVEMLRPMLRTWLDDNMPRIVEKALKAETVDRSRPDKSA